MDLDPPRAALLKFIAVSDTNLTALARALGMNPTYFHQFVYKYVPRNLKQEVREAVEDYLGLERGAIPSGEQPNSRNRNLRITSFLNKNSAESKALQQIKDSDKHGRDAGGADIIQSNVDLRKPANLGKLFPNPRKDLPVFSSAAAGEGFFYVSTEPSEWIDRPAVLTGAADAFAVYFPDDSMFPRYEHGEILWVHPRPPARGKDAYIVTIKKGSERRFSIKRYIETKDNIVYLEQYNPKEIIEVPLSSIVSMHSIAGVYRIS